MNNPTPLLQGANSVSDLNRCGCGEIPKEIYALRCNGVSDVDLIIVPTCCRDWLIGFESRNVRWDPYDAWENKQNPLHAEMINAWNGARRPKCSENSQKETP